MNLDASLLATAHSYRVTKQYYDLCERYCFEAGVPLKKTSVKEVLAAASGQVDISKLSGPGTVFQLRGLPEGTSLNFIVQSGGTVETDFCVTVDGQEVLNTFAVFCNAARRHQGLPPPDPAYPRPVCRSSEDMIAVFRKLKELVLLLSERGPHRT